MDLNDKEDVWQTKGIIKHTWRWPKWSIVIQSSYWNVWALLSLPSGLPFGKPRLGFHLGGKMPQMTNHPLSCLSCCYNQFPRVFELHNLWFGENFIQEDLVGKREELPLSSKSLKQIIHGFEPTKESGVRLKPSSIRRHIREIQSIPKKHGPKHHGVQGC